MNAIRNMDAELKVIAVIVALAAIIIGVLIWMTAGYEDELSASCSADGGTLTSDTDTHVASTFNASTGQPGVAVSSSTDYFCMTDDGRILWMK